MTSATQYADGKKPHLEKAKESLFSFICQTEVLMYYGKHVLMKPSLY